MISIALSTTGTAILCNLLNKSMVTNFGAALFVFGIASIAVMAALGVLTAIVATFLPVWNTAKKKPVESIRAL